MLKDSLVSELQVVKAFFERSTDCLSEEDSNFKPKEEMLTVAQQVAHCAQSIDWFIDGMNNPDGFNMDFEGHWKTIMPCTSL